MTDYDDTELMPRKLRSLDEISTDLHDCYQEVDGSFELTPDALAQAEEYEEELREVLAENAAEMQKRVRRIRKMEALLSRGSIDGALGAALKQHGCAAKYIAPAAALLSQQHKLVADLDGDGPVHALVDGEPVAVEAIVSDFLSSDRGAPFRGEPKPSRPAEPGDVERRIRLIGESLH